MYPQALRDFDSGDGLLKTLFWRCGYSMVLLFLLAGCFQQAGESLQSAGSTAAPDQANATTEIILSTDMPTQEGVPAADASPSIEVTRPPSTGPTTATLPPITIIFQPTETLRPTEDTSGAQSDENTVGFITPGSPLGPGLDEGDLTPVPGDTLESTLSSDVETAPTEVELPAGVDAECSYIIESGDTVFGIALSFDTTVAELQEINPELEGDNPVIQPGQIVILPECNNIPGEETEEPEIIEATGTSTRVPSVIEPVVPGTTATSAAGGGTETYIVQRGDTLFIIAQRYGTTVAALVNANNLSNPDRLSVGQQLIIPQRP
jgi:LysM repeat protein